MPIVTLTSDYGEGSPHIAQLKGALLSRAPQATPVDVTHSVRKFDPLEAVFHLRQIAPEFPDETIHLMCVKVACNRPLRLVKYRRQYYLGADNEAFGLLFDEGEPLLAFDLSEVRSERALPTFPEREWFVPAAAHLANGGAPELLGRVAPPLQPGAWIPPRVETDALIGRVLYIDHYGNAVTNITREVFERVVGERSFLIPMRSTRMDFRKVHAQYDDVGIGDSVALFNAAGYLELAMNNQSAPGGNGGADALLGLFRDQDVRIEFTS